MKRLIFLLTIIILLSVSIFKVSVSDAAPADPRCLSFNVTFTAKNWVGGPVQIGCQGLHKGPCTGGIKDIRPGTKNSVTLNNCACPFNAKGKEKDWADGCLYVAKELKVTQRSVPGESYTRPGVGVKTPLPSKCTFNSNKFTAISSGFYKTKKNYCGENKTQVPISFSITCPGKTVTPTDTNTPTPTTNICPALSPVTGVHISCPNCGTTETEEPTATLTPTATVTPTTVTSSSDTDETDASTEEEDITE